MEKGKYYSKSLLFIVAIVFEVVFVVFVIITVVGILKKNDVEVAKLKIENYSAIPEGRVIGSKNNGVSVNFELNETKKSMIESTLYDEVLLNNNGGIYNSVKIREGSAYYVYISELDVYLLNFLIDIDELKQSYRLIYRWADRYPNENIAQNVSVLSYCPDEDELINGDFKCKDAYNGRGNDIVVHDILLNKTFSNFAVGVSGDVYNGEPLSISINTYSDDETTKESAIEEVSSYLSSVGFDLNDFDYTVGIRFAE